MSLSQKAIVFGIGLLRGPKSRLSFGGEGAEMRITEQGRAALDELLEAGYAEPAEPDTQIPGREYYRGTEKPWPEGFNPFAVDEIDDWVSFERIPA